MQEYIENLIAEEEAAAAAAAAAKEAAAAGDFQITVSTDAEKKDIRAHPTDVVHDVIAAAFGRPVWHIEEALLGDDAVQPNQAFYELGIEDGARLSVRLRYKATFEDVVAEMIDLNRSLMREQLMRGVMVDPEDAFQIQGDVNWSAKDINFLPESIGDLIVDGHLFLDGNNLATLPASFGDLQVGKTVWLYGNPVAVSGPHFDGLDVNYDNI